LRSISSDFGRNGLRVRILILFLAPQYSQITGPASVPVRDKTG
jgi:hypothetical protein